MNSKNKQISLSIPTTYHIAAIPESSDEEFDITHGITMWAHNTLGFTIARDVLYMGKPLNLISVLVSPNPPIADVGKFWLDTSSVPGVLKTYRNDEWIECVWIEKGTMLFDQKNDRVLVKMTSEWHALQSTPL